MLKLKSNLIALSICVAFGLFVLSLHFDLKAHADDGSQIEVPIVKHQITGLFQPDRVEDLKKVLAKTPQFKLIRVDYDTAEAEFQYDPAKVWGNQKPERYVELFDRDLRSASRNTFGCKPLRTVPVEKLFEIEIDVAGLDCKGCSYAAYEMIYQAKGVERATANFKLGKVIAWVDPDKATRDDLEALLRKGGVAVLPIPENTK